MNFTRAFAATLTLTLKFTTAFIFIFIPSNSPRFPPRFPNHKKAASADRAFRNGKPWPLRFFDLVRFYPVDENELIKHREAFRRGQLNIKIVNDHVFNLRDYNAFLRSEAESIAHFTTNQAAAFAKEVSQWQQDIESEKIDPSSIDVEVVYHEAETSDEVNVTAEVCGNVWKVLVNIGDVVEISTPLVILEAMKMELIVRAPISGKISSLQCVVGRLVDTKDVLVRIK